MAVEDGRGTKHGFGDEDGSWLERETHPPPALEKFLDTGETSFWLNLQTSIFKPDKKKSFRITASPGYPASSLYSWFRLV